MTHHYIGIMSGTSMDAIDAVICQFHPQKFELIASHSSPISAQLRSDLQALCVPGENEIHRAAQLDVQLGHLYADLVLELLEIAQLKPSDIAAIGNHGQTIRHMPQLETPFTLQIGDPNIIASKTGITTIGDFRRRDIAQGGQGAPLAPLFHGWFFQKACVVANIGGMANISVIEANSLRGFDTGPGNTLLDLWSARHLQQPYDHNGAWARQGNIDERVLANMLSDPYFQTEPPKSTGREYFNADWLAQHFQSIDPQNGQATLTELTALTLSQAIKSTTQTTGPVILCGGGVKNDYLLERLQKALDPYPVSLSDEHGLPSQWLEAIAFAWLAQQTLAGQRFDLKTVTGAKTPVILGGIYPV